MNEVGTHDCIFFEAAGYRFLLYPNSLLIMLLWENMQLMEMNRLQAELQSMHPRALGTLGFFLDSDSSFHTEIVLTVHSRFLCLPLLYNASLNLGQKLHTHQRLYSLLPF